MKLSEELLKDLQPICIRFYFDLLQNAFPGIWSGELTLNQMRVNNCVYTRQMVEGKASTAGNICDDSGIARTTVNRALETLKKSSSNGTEGYRDAIIEELRDPDDDRKRLYQLKRGRDGQMEKATRDFTELLAGLALEMLPVLRKHGVILGNEELLSFIKEQIPHLVEEHLQQGSASDDLTAGRG